MDALVTPSGTDSQFEELMAQSPIPVDAVLECVRNAAQVPETAKKADEWTKKLVQKFVADGDFENLYKVVRECSLASLFPVEARSIGDLLRKNCKDRTLKAMLEAANFGGYEVLGKDVPRSTKGALAVELKESFRRFDTLCEFQASDQVIDNAWGFGVVKRVDAFYKRIIIDFRGRPNHALAFSTACNTLRRASKLHFWSILHNEPQNIANLVQNEPEKVVRLVLHSFGQMPIQRIEDRLVSSGVIKKDEWKKFWERARMKLKEDKRIKIPTRRTDPIVIFAKEESFDDDYFARLKKKRIPAEILTAVGELTENDKLKSLTDEQREILKERLQFVLKGAERVDMPLYARVAVIMQRLGFQEPPIDQLRQTLWQDNICLKAAYKLSVRDTDGLTQLLLSGGEEAEKKLIEALSYSDEPATDTEPPHYALCCAMFYDVLNALKDKEECQEACFTLLNKPKAPAALVGWMFKNRKGLLWKKQIPFIRLIDHAMALVEMNASGETLQVQNQLKLILSDTKWWDEALAELKPTEKRLLFERIQSSAQLDSPFQRKLLTSMLNLAPELKRYKKAAGQREKVQSRMTSLHSMAEKQASFRRLVEIEIPKNRLAIQEAKEKGDLSENAEYQYAKEKERELLQRQSELNEEIKLVKETDFANMPTDHVGQGVTVVLALPDGQEQTYTILGEWDYDERLKIISCNTRMAKAVENAKVGDSVKIPSPEGETSATIRAILPLSDEIREWIHTLPQE